MKTKHEKIVEVLRERYSHGYNIEEAATAICNLSIPQNTLSESKVMEVYIPIKSSEELPGIPGWYIAYQNDDPFKVLKQVEYEGLRISGDSWEIKYTWLKKTALCNLSVVGVNKEEIKEVLSIAMGELLHNSNVIPDSWFDITANKIRNLSVVDHYEEQKQHSHTATDLSIVGVSEEECDFCHSKTHPDNVRKICYDCSQSMP